MHLLQPFPLDLIQKMRLMPGAPCPCQYVFLSLLNGKNEQLKRLLSADIVAAIFVVAAFSNVYCEEEGENS